MTRFARVSDEVQAALGSGQGVVALESTLIAQGLPWPENLETPLAAEATVRGAGSVPATIAVLGGTVRLGLTETEIEHIARSGTFAKASRRDLGMVVARGLDAATTVSATLRIACMHGVFVLATGGLGGVHRDAATTFDVSTDLDELASADGALVVCSGVKSILDIAATLEVLETRGVPVVGYRTDDFPAFTSMSSGQRLDVRADTPEEAAAIVRSHRELGLPGAVVMAQCVPTEVALDRQEMETKLDGVLGEARSRGIAGKAVTPFLLDRLRHATDGRSLRANRALIVANAALAGAIAAAIGLSNGRS